MLTIIFPGYSLKNKEWALEIAKEMKLGHKTLVHEWRHWQEGSFSVNYEVEKILEEIGKEDEVNIIAKSVGTAVTMRLLQKLDGAIKKIILCGIPTVSEERLELFKEALSEFPQKDILVIQNDSDPLINFTDAREFMGKVNPEIKTVKKEGGTHNYPYPEDFESFIVSGN